MSEARCDMEGVSAFRGALRRARRWELLQSLHGRPVDQLPFDVVTTALHLHHRTPVGVREVPCDAIIGSVDRAGDFTRNHLPRKDYMQSRWCRIHSLMLQQGFEPISVFKASDIYFVNDGNHRLSVLSSFGAKMVEADVTEFDCRVPLDKDVRISDLARKAAYADFLEQTDLDRQRPGMSIDLSVPASYRKLEEHIAGHAYWLEYTSGHPVSVYRAAASWYDLVYAPTMQMIRARNLARDFAGLREADLYLGATEYHRQLARRLGRPVPLDLALEHYRMAAARPKVLRLWYRLMRGRRLRLKNLAPLPARAPLPTRRPIDAPLEENRPAR